MHQDAIYDCTKTLYTAPVGASPLQVMCSPTASGTSPNGAVSASVTYTASVSPVTITLGGTYDPIHGDNHVLTGQQITATLNGIPGGFTVTKYTWSGVSATCFETYNEKATSNQLVALSTSDLSGPASGSNTVAALKFYDSAAENLTVTCTVAVNAPDGTSLSLTATAPPINVLKPTVTN